MNIQKWLPKSLLARTLWFTLLAVFLAQMIATTIWYGQSKQRDLQGLESASASMANMFASTVTFFQSLPLEYRHIVLDQLRNMGGTRFFVSFNEEEILIDPIPSSQMKNTAVRVFEEVLSDKLPSLDVIRVEFSRPETLHVLKNDILLSDLPRSWAHYTLSLEPLNPPILVVQLELAENEWLYIAGLLPSPYVSLEDEIITSQQVIFMGFITTLLLLFTYFMIRRQTKPLKRLANAANALSFDIYQPPLKEEGASELVTATRAFNRMQLRVRRYIDDREHLFSAISHDLKTPITRLRLRAELIDDESKIEKFNNDLDELEMMVKGALQTVKDTDLHENLTQVDIAEMLRSIAEQHNQELVKVHIPDIKIAPLTGKPLALKRCFSNLIENGVKYGDEVRLIIVDEKGSLIVIIKDSGPGIPEASLEAVFEPYVRIAKDDEGHGLGMGIARNIIHAHGGDMAIHNSVDGGLEVKVFIPRLIKEK
ncbi:two-component sensor histidine kinase [Photobacterium sanctipauli]|uniref:histidine kinase n=2 Tax=Photobacterium sanctipauli TaxID=1342794 RepID=A0A2T3P138_9GAMM|nr:ATP-binding protein [Photobacterium sanctipauli]PSW22235.1 two-component sensor histidine kinase [Photobacterium sanctipauli]